MFKHSQEIDKIVAALAAFQGEVTSPPKNREVDTGKYKFKYAELATILEHIKAPFKANGFAWTSVVVYPEGRAPMLITRLFHSSGQWFEMEYRLPNGGDSKQFAGEITYGRRYSFSMMLGLASEQDADEMPPAQNQGNRNQGQQRQGPPQNQGQRGPQQGNQQGRGAAPNNQRPQGQQAQPTTPTNTTGANAPTNGAPGPTAATKNSSAGSAPKGECTQADLDKLTALVADQTRFNPWSNAQLTEFMAAKYQRVRLGSFTRAEFNELMEAVGALSFNQAMELVERANQPLPDGDPEPTEPGAEG